MGQSHERKSALGSNAEADVSVLHGDSKDIGLRYRFSRGVFTFDDGVKYSFEEAMHLSKTRCKGDDLKKVHYIKKLFDGEVVTSWGF